MYFGVQEGGGLDSSLSSPCRTYGDWSDKCSYTRNSPRACVASRQTSATDTTGQSLLLSRPIALRCPPSWVGPLCLSPIKILLCALCFFLSPSSYVGSPLGQPLSHKYYTLTMIPATWPLYTTLHTGTVCSKRDKSK
eukprot:TRINITY_DN6777_c0_g1_i2.p1 TRINITY_DN6777_c0_g1~~TRINITY_DN6777_c0_g1_i2.p1  ORF type:complete len:137 (+),score=1.23 TRINITY_DN6777_c0_g1_i2:370-780(+)